MTDKSSAEEKTVTQTDADGTYREPEAATVTVEGLLDLIAAEDPDAAALVAYVRETGQVEDFHQSIVRRGAVEHPAPWTPAEAEAIKVWALTPMAPGPHGPGCECGQGDGNTPAEKRTGVSDAEHAIMGELDRIPRAAAAMAKAAAATMKASADIRTRPTALLEAINSTVDAQAMAVDIADSLAKIRAWLPQVRGKQATDAEGTPLWLVNAGQTDWFVAALAEPQEGWVPVYVR